jgi:PBSX family phage portal protein
MDGSEIRSQVVKATLLPRDGVAESNASATEDDTQSMFEEAGCLEPPYDPTTLCRIFESSNCLRQNVDAYTVNIDGFGHEFSPIVDLETDDARAQVADVLALDANIDDSEVPKAEIDAAILKIEATMRREKVLLKNLFDSCCADESFVGLRRRTRLDLEVTGNAYWEILRNKRSQIANFVHLPSYTMRLKKLSKPVEVTETIRSTILDVDRFLVRRRFRGFAQIVESQTVHFKALGDPRVISRIDGKDFGVGDEALRALRERNLPGDGPATEVIHFKITSPRGPYGIPRWIGVLAGVLGSREAEEVNYSYFENKSVPPLALLVSNARVGQDSVSRIEDYIQTNIRGKKNFHKILIIEAESDNLTEGTGRASVKLQPLTDAQQKDALFQRYDERNIDKVGMAFRNPRIVRGDMRDFNRSTSQSALEFAEQQIYQPEREDFDWVITRRIFSDLGVTYWNFRSKGPTRARAGELSEMYGKLVERGIITPAECRMRLNDVVQRPFESIDEEWTKRPPIFTIEGFTESDDEEWRTHKPGEWPSEDPPMGEGAEPPGAPPGDTTADESAQDQNDESDAQE